MTEPDTSLFARYIPGFEFLQNLSRQAAGSTAPGSQSSVPGMPALSHWVAPTLDVEELDKRIQDLRAVHFWLDQNTKALAATIQALEVQKMTLATLKSMNVSLHDMAEAFKIRPDSGSGPGSAPAPDPSPHAAPRSDSAARSADADPASRPVVDPMQWWSALTQQFQTIATGAMQEMAQHAARTAEQMAHNVQAGAEAVTADQPVAGTNQAPAQRRSVTKKSARKTATAPAPDAAPNPAPKPVKPTTKTPSPAPAKARQPSARSRASTRTRTSSR